MSSKTQSVTEKALVDQFQHVGTLIAAAIAFGFALLLGILHPTAPVIASLANPAIDLVALVQQLIAGGLFIIAIIMAFIKQRFGVALSAVMHNGQAIAIGSTIVLLGNTLLGLAGTAPDPASKALLSVLGGAFVLIGIYLGGTVGLALGAAVKD